MVDDPFNETQGGAWAVVVVSLVVASPASGQARSQSCGGLNGDDDDDDDEGFE